MNFCPHCHSGNDPVLKDTTWSCGVRFNDSTWRTKECYERQNARLKQRIKRLKEALDLVRPNCDSVHHSKKHQHQYGEPCPVVALIENAKEAKL